MSDAAHRKGEAGAAFREGLQAFLDILAEHLRRCGTEDSRRTAIATWASLTGAIMLARAVDDEKLSQEILRTVADQLRGT